MADKCFVWPDPVTGQLCLNHPGYGDRSRPPNDTDEALEERVRAKNIPAGVNALLIPVAALPITDTRAWHLVGNSVVGTGIIPTPPLMPEQKEFAAASPERKMAMLAKRLGLVQ